VEQMISAPAVQFKGSGWYVTDYANKSHRPLLSEGGSSESKKEEKSKPEDSSKSDASKESSAKETPSKDNSSKTTFERRLQKDNRNASVRRENPDKKK